MNKWLVAAVAAAGLGTAAVLPPAHRAFCEPAVVLLAPVVPGAPSASGSNSSQAPHSLQ